MSGRWARAAAVARIAPVAPVALVPCIFTTRIDDVFYLPKLVALWAVLIAAVWLVAARPPDRLPRPSWVDAAAAAFVAWNLVALAFSSDPRQSLFGERLQHQGTLTLLLYGAFYALARVLVTDIWPLLRALVLGAAAVSAYAIVQALGLDPIWGDEVPGGRVFSTIGQPNGLAAYLVLALPAAVALAAKERQPAYVASAAGIAVAIGLTQSRGAYLAIAVLAVLLVVWIGRAAAVPVAVVTLVAVPLVGPRLLTIAEGTGELSIANHVDTWRVAVRVIADHPIVGTGPETFPDQFVGYSRAVLPTRRVAYFDQFRVESPHNRYLAAATDAGVPALVAYVVFIAGVFAVVRRRIDDPAAFAITAALAGHLVTDAFMSAEVASTWLFWVFAGAAVSVVSEWSDRSAAAVAADDAHRQP